MDKPKSPAEKTTRTTVDTIGFTVAQAKAWKIPPFQRPLKVNDKVKAVAELIRQEGGVLPGILTFGHLKGEKEPYLIDGQHRREGFFLAEVPEGYADVRNCFFDTMAEMGQEFVNLQSHLVVMRPDDVLRGLESASPALAAIRRACPFVGYDQVRRGPNSPLLSMSTVVRNWESSEKETPGTGSGSAAKAAAVLSTDSVKQLTDFLKLAFKAWGRDPAYYPMWGALNLVLCMWLYRRLVVAAWSVKTKQISDELFGKCLMSLSADPAYGAWLVGRKVNDRDRSPAYGRVKSIFVGRLLVETGKRHQLPAPPWTLGQKGGSR